jgi:hypothetical protein
VVSAADGVSWKWTTESATNAANSTAAAIETPMASGDREDAVALGSHALRGFVK